MTGVSVLLQSAAVSGDQALLNAPKRLFHTCFGSRGEESGMRNRIPCFPGCLVS